MRRALGLVVALLLLSVTTPQARRACAGSSPNWTSTADHTSLCACISGATAGDTITVTGNATWTSGIEFTRGVNLIGSGNPTITGIARFLWWDDDATARFAHDTLKMPGFTFDGDDSFERWVWAGHPRLFGWRRVLTAVILDNTFKNTDARGIYV